jgi:hypothetical protein
MTNKLVVIINSLKYQKLRKSLLYEIKFVVPNYSCLQNPWLRGYRPQNPVLSVLCPQLNLLNPPPPKKNSWVRHCSALIRVSCVRRIPRSQINFSRGSWHYSCVLCLESRSSDKRNTDHCTNKCIYIYIYIYIYIVQNYITDAPECVGASAPTAGSLDLVRSMLWNIKII